MRAKFVNLDEDAMGGVSAPMATLNNTPGVGNAVPGSPDTDMMGSGDKWGNSPKKKKKRKVYKKKKKKVNENNISPYDKIGIMMAKKMKVPLPFEKAKNQETKHVTQKDPEKLKYKHKLRPYSDFKMKTKKKENDAVEETVSEGLKINGTEYDVYSLPGFNAKAFANSRGLLGPNNVVIPWGYIKTLIKRYSPE